MGLECIQIHSDLGKNVLDRLRRHGEPVEPIQHGRFDALVVHHAMGHPVTESDDRDGLGRVGVRASILVRPMVVASTSSNAQGQHPLSADALADVRMVRAEDLNLCFLARDLLADARGRDLGERVRDGVQEHELADVVQERGRVGLVHITQADVLGQRAHTQSDAHRMAPQLDRAGRGAGVEHGRERRGEGHVPDGGCVDEGNGLRDIDDSGLRLEDG